MDGSLSLLKTKSHLFHLDPTSSYNLAIKSAESYAIGDIKHTVFCQKKKADFLFGPNLASKGRNVKKCEIVSQNIFIQEHLNCLIRIFNVNNVKQ